MTGVPFTRILAVEPTARIAVEHAFGADLAAADPGTWTWVDTTTDVMYAGGGVGISPMGRGDEFAKAQPAGSKYQLLNTSGTYSKGLPSSPYWPNVRRNTPVRVSVQSTLSPTFRSVATTTGAGSSLVATAPAGVAAGDVVVAFHTADLSLLGELRQPSGAPWRLLTTVETADIGGGITFGRLATKVWWYRAAGAAPANYTFTQSPAADGVVSIVAVQNARLYTLKATTSTEVPPGASFDTPSSSPLRSDDFELRWAAGSDVAGVAGVTWTPPAGLTERADAQSNTFTTATLATRTVGATTATGVKTFTASSGLLDWGHGVTVNISNMNVRKQGYANGFTPEWDASAKVATVKGSASGILRRLQQGKSPLRSVLFRSHLAAGPVAYWPLEDGRDATQGASALSGGNPFVWTGTPPTRSNGGPPGSEPMWTFDTNTDAAGIVAPYTPTTAGWWGWQMVFNPKAAVTLNPTISLMPICVILCGGDIPKWGLTLDPTTFSPVPVLRVEAFNVAGAQVVNDVINIQPLFANNNLYDHDLIVGMNIHQNGGNIDYDGAIFGPDFADGAVHTLPSGSIAGTNGLVQGFRIPTGYAGNRPGWVFGHISAWGKAFQLYSNQVNGLRGVETATQRLARLCAEEGVPIDIRGSSQDIMGPQGADQFVNLLRECETTDDGVLYDGRGFGLSYVARAVRYNAPVALTADMAADPPQVGIPFRPADNDQRDRNLVTVTRKNGSSATYEDDFSPLGTQAIGTYDSKVTPDPNYTDDSVNLFRAAHEVHKGTVDEPYRYPQLVLDLGATPALIYDWLTADVSSRINATNVSTKTTQHPPGDIDLLLEGWAETLTPFEWTVTGNCSPFQPWRVAVIEGAGDTTWRIDSGSSTLAASAIAGATSISVASSNPAELWSTVAGDYPRDIDVRGVKVRVTAVAGAASPQTFTVTALPYALTAGWPVRLWRPPTIAL